MKKAVDKYRCSLWITSYRKQMFANKSSGKYFQKWQLDGLTMQCMDIHTMYKYKLSEFSDNSENFSALSL